MQKQTKLDLADSNIALLGSELDKQVRLHAAETEKMWTGVGQTPGVLIWRIENFHVVPQPLPEYGSFYSGDSYIVLNTYMVSDSYVIEFTGSFCRVDLFACRLIPGGKVTAAQRSFLARPVYNAGGLSEADSG